MIAHALGAALFHSLWQGTIVAALLSLALAALRPSQLRYLSACAALLAMFACFILTFFYFLPASVASLNAPQLLATLPGGGPASWRMTSDPALYFPWLAPCWLAGVAFFQLRGLAGWVAASRLRTRGVCSPPDLWQQRLATLQSRIQLAKPVRLLETALGNVPVVVGWLRPVILVPIGMFATLPASQIEAILLHELAHVRRHDYLVNLLQSIIEGFLFYHPAAWWISRVIRTERENCCDDFVVTVSGDAHEYASALTALEQTRWAAHNAVLAANGGSLVKRIRRLLDPQTNTRATLTPVIAAGILTLIGTLALFAWQATPKSAEQELADKMEKNRFSAWLNEDVVYIVTPAERKAFNALATDEERTHFIAQFWDRRNPVPGDPRNQFKEEHYRRIAYVNEHFSDRLPGWKTDRGRVYITYGPPDELEQHPLPAGETLEQWRYKRIPNVGNGVIIDFVNGQMTKDPNPSTGVPVLQPK